MSADLRTRGQGTRDQGAWDRAWADALTDLEMDLALAERLLDHAHLLAPAEVARVAAWRPPTGLGPLPASLLVRAQALLDRQLDVARRTAEAAALSRRQLAVTEALHARPAAVPVYLDIET